eukprot:Hpha_TRINITY_DN19247_c0_g1::TRINITY_DN19247_c0_g1_i1::g.194289::m.194289
MKSAAVLLLGLLGAAAGSDLRMTFRTQYMGGVSQGHFGRQEWIPREREVTWAAAETGVVIVDMWDKHWCPSATTRVAELAVPMNDFVGRARESGVTVIWAPSDVTDFYTGTPERNNTLNLPEATLPHYKQPDIPTFPLGTSTDGGCDVEAKEHNAWSRQIATLQIQPSDFLISAVVEKNSSQKELNNVISAKKLRHLIYLGVHENMCILNRPFALETMHAWGWTQDNLAVVRDLVDVMYTPRDPPYVSHDEGLRIHTAYVEKFWAGSVSMYDILAPYYNSTARN